MWEVMMIIGTGIMSLKKKRHFRAIVWRFEYCSSSGAENPAAWCIETICSFKFVWQSPASGAWLSVHCQNHIAASRCPRRPACQTTVSLVYLRWIKLWIVADRDGKLKHTVCGSYFTSLLLVTQKNPTFSKFGQITSHHLPKTQVLIVHTRPRSVYGAFYN